MLSDSILFWMFNINFMNQLNYLLTFHLKEQNHHWPLCTNWPLVGPLPTWYDPIDVRNPVFDAFFGRSIVLRIISIFVKKFFTIFKNCSPIYLYVPSFLKSENLYINKNFLNFFKITILTWKSSSDPRNILYKC